ncbi:MFS transporter [Halopseudomonas maritima]|uniref:MFS transporter n=1 Tax=Halopseudomonas maritima TaxID=2918528 RepID=UPI001EEB2B45|nr:MFS transporter [Halopseudomonas maritima]UJJ30399.1 MFS transporter [Halopseudomonas maritima]
MSELSTDLSDAAVQTSAQTPARSLSWLILLALAVGGFGIGTGEFVIMGLMPTIAADLAVTEPQVGHVISSYALGVVVGAPILAIFGARLYRRHLLLLLMGFFALGNLASALAPDYHSLLLARFVAGLPHGAYFGVAALVAASLVAPNKRAAAVSLVMLGLTLAILLGNPLATLLGQQFDWRYAFVAVAVIALLTVLLIALLLPLERGVARSNPLAELQAFRRIQVWYALGIGAIGFAGMFCVFSYLAVTLLEVTGVAPLVVPLAVATFGAGTLVGNLAGGWLFERLQFGAVGVVLLWSIGVLLLFPFAVHTLWSALLAAFLVGTMVALSPPLQTRLMDVAADAQTLAAASHHAAFNVANALGPWLGGLAISAGLGWTVTGYVGAGTALIGLLLFVLAWRREQRHPEELHSQDAAA